MDQCLDTPLDVLAALRHAMLSRRNVPCQFTEGRDTGETETLMDKVKRILSND